MYRLARIRLSGVGPPDARYDRPSPDAAPFEINCLGPSGLPEDTVVWLENGGGKTVFLALLFHVLRPDKAPQIGNDEKGRRGDISDFLLPGDVAHVVCEWVADDTDERLITGLVAERRGANTSRTWYLLVVRDDTVTLDHLVFDTDGRRVAATPYIESLQQLAARAGKVGRRNRVEFVRTSVQRTWLETLANHRLDPALFEYQVRMNRSEGGATSLFRFPSAEKFIEFFLELTMNSDTVSALSETLGRVADKVASLPRKETELAHATGAIERLDRLTRDWENFQKADTARQRAQRTAEELYDRMSAAVTLASHAVVDAEAYVDEATERQRAADRQRRDTDARARALAIAAADTRLAEQDAQIDEAEQLRGDLALTARAWPRIGLALTRNRLTGEIGELRRALAAADADAAPLRARRDALLRALRDELDTRRRAADVDMRTARSARKAADADIEKADEARRDADGRIREIDGRSKELTKQVTRHERALAAAVADGVLSDGAEPAAVLSDVEADLERLKNDEEMLTAERVQQAARRPELRQAAKIASETARSAANIAERHRDVVAAAQDERERLAANPLLAELGGTDADLELVGAELTRRVAEESDRHRVAAVAAAAASAEDRRAVDTLERDRLLPARAEVDTLCTQLHVGGVASAVPGWRYIVEALPADDHLAAIATHPAVADGIVVASTDLDRARKLLADVAPAAAIVVAPGALLTNSPADPADPAGAWVVRPAPAMHDVTQAEAELARRTERLDAAAERQQKIADVERVARDLAAALSDHLDTWPPGALTAAVVRRDELDYAARQAAEDSDAAAGDVAAVEKWIDELDSQLNELRDRYRNTEQRRGRLSQLAAGAATAAEAQDELDVLTVDRNQAVTDVDAAKSARTVAARRQDRASDAYRTAERAAEATDRILADLPDVEPGPVAKPAPLEELRASYQQAARIVEEATTDSDLARRLRELQAGQASAEQGWMALATELRDRVESLLTTPAAADPTARSAAETEAEHVADEAQQHVSDLRAQRDVTDAHRRRLPEPERAVDLGDLPDTADELEALCDTAAARADTAREQRSIADEELRRANQALERARSKVTSLEGLLSALSTAVGEHEPQPAPVFDGDPSKDVRRTLSKITETTKLRENALNAWTNSAAAVGTFARDPRWSELTGDLPRRLRNDPPESLARAAADLLAQTRVLAGRLSDDIDALDTHRQLLVTSLADAVSEAHRSLRRARAKSTLPDGLGAWSRQPFLKIGLAVPSDRAELDSRLRRFTNDILEHATIGGTGLPTGAPLVCRAVLACAEKTVTVDVLKPNKAQRLRYEPITEMATLSGGMRATAAIAMFCTLARVRATNRTARAGVGTLVLDNPIGDANAPYLVALQRMVAQMSDVQLVYTTGVNDMDALRLFPVLTRLTNEAAKRSHLAYVVADEAFLKSLAPAAGDHAIITSTRLIRHQLPLLTVDLGLGPADDAA